MLREPPLLVRVDENGGVVESIYRSSERYRDDFSRVEAFWLANREWVAESLRTNPGSNYQGRRGSMVIDAICSRQRKYSSRVLPLVAKWESTNSEPTLAQLIESARGDLQKLGLLESEPQTLVDVAKGFLKFGQERSIRDEDQIVKQWALEVQELRHFTKLDPYVGSVPGVGPALFAYMRMLSGVDALKVDLRVSKALRRLGTYVPADTTATLHLCELYAEDLGITLRELDRLLYGNLT
jgi:hypothetical protein